MIHVLKYILGIPFWTMPVNMYIRNESLWSFTITPKYHPILFKNIETHKPFASLCFQFISVHSIKITGFLYHVTLSLIYNKDLFYYHFWNKIICNFSHIFSHDLNSIIEKLYFKSSILWIWYIFGMVILKVNIYRTWNIFL